MLKFSIAFLVPDNKNSLKHCIIESATKDDVLRIFFKNELHDFYSDDEKRRRQMKCRESDNLIVVMKWGNAHGAKEVTPGELLLMNKTF